MPPPTLTRRAALAGAAALGLVRPSRAAEAPGAELIVSAYGLPYVPAAIEGRPVLASLDTGGARGVQLSETLATALGHALAPTGQTTRRLDGSMRPVAAGTVSAFEIAGARFAPQAVAVAGNDIETIARQVGVAFDAILGWAFLGARPFVIDYPGRRFALGAASAPAPELTLKLVEAPRAPVTEGAVACATVRLLVDTGAPMSNLDMSLAGGAALNSIVTRPATLAGRSFDLAFRVRDLTAIRQGLGAAAVIGHSFLKDYRVGFDPAAGALTLAK